MGKQTCVLRVQQETVALAADVMSDLIHVCSLKYFTARQVCVCVCVCVCVWNVGLVSWCRFNITW